MIPPLDDCGNLPPGIHPATLAEVEARFGRASELRRVQMESIRWMIDLAVRAGVERVILNGSFVTDTIEPDDVDCVLLVTSELASIKLRKKNYSTACHSWIFHWSAKRTSTISSIDSLPRIALWSPKA